MHERYINFKEWTAQFDPCLVLWIKFKDGNERTFKNISFPASLAQMYFEKMPVKASLKHVWDTYHKLLHESFKGKWRIARIYRKKNNGPDSFVVQYHESGEVIYHDSKGNPVGSPTIEFEGSKLRIYEKRLEDDMNLYIIKMRHAYTK